MKKRTVKKSEKSHAIHRDIHEKTEILKNRLFSVFLIVLVVVIAILGIIKKVGDTGRVVDENFVTTIDIIAVSDYYNKEATVEKALAARDAVKSIAKPVEAAKISSYENIVSFFSITDSYREQAKLIKVTDPEYNIKLNTLINQFANVLFSLDIRMPNSLAISVIKDVNDTLYDSYKTTVRTQFISVMSESIHEGNIDYYKESFVKKVNDAVVDNNLTELTGYIVDRFVSINSIVDLVATASEKDRVYNDIMENSPVIVKAGSVLYKKNTVLNAEQQKVLTDMGISTISKSIYLYAGAAVLFILTLLGAFASKSIHGHNAKLQPKTMLITVLLFFIVYVPALFVPNEYYLYIPYFVLPMMLAILVSDSAAYVFSITLGIFYCYIVGADIAYLSVLIIGSITTIYIVRKTYARVKLALAGLILGIVNVLVYVSYLLLTTDVTFNVPYGKIIALFIASLVSSLLSLGLLPIFEASFNIVTPFKLIELTSPASPLLKRLMVEAPGSYHHSLMVGNLAEEAAVAIGANGLLARVGSYYHDVGKLNRPSFFSENQSTKTGNPHDSISPQLSAAIITSHTLEGEQLAKQSKLPPAIRDIIVQHHGTTLVEYFYHKAKSMSNEPVLEEDFRYSGPKPRTKEAACVMLADSCEAAIRSMETTNTIEIEKAVRNIIKAKRDDGQFDRCDLTLKDLDEILFVFMKVFTGYFHQRIKYPGQNSERNLNMKAEKEKENENENQN